MKRTLIFILLNLSILLVAAQPPADYYSSAMDKDGQELMEALYNIIEGHTVMTYTPGLWNAYYETDVRPDGSVWDIYSSCDFILGDDQDRGSGGNVECEYYNREHTFPRSWFGGTVDPMNTDIHHVFPTDKKVNAVRSSYPYGEVDENPTYTSSNGSKLGNSSYPGYSGIVFEPIDEYKGDLARVYFYIASRYYDIIKEWNCEITNGSQYPAYKEWVINMFLEWHVNDPVSEKELNRNNIIFEKYQHNRNPFVDHPEFAIRIWGENTSERNLLNGFATKIFPNPANNIIKIEFTQKGEYNIAFYNAQGSVIKRKTIQTDSKFAVISVGDLPAGLYYVKISNSNIDESKKLIITN